MNFAVVEIAGKQFLVQENEIIEIPKIPGSTGEQVSFPQVLFYWDGQKAAIGRPYLDGFSVEGKIISQGKSPKVVVYKYKRRKDSHRKMGHRQDFYRVGIEKIVVPGKISRERKGEENAQVKAKKAEKNPAPKLSPQKEPREAAGTEENMPAPEKQ